MQNKRIEGRSASGAVRVSEPGPLLDFLLRHFAHLKRAKVIEILKHGSVRVNGRLVTLHRHPLKAGDRIEFLSREKASEEKLKHDLGLKIVYEDDAVIVVHKKAGLLTVSTAKEKELTLQFLLNEYTRAHAVHRLDRDTSGLVVFAKTETAKQTLQANWPKVVKKYLAVTEGVPREAAGTVKSKLFEDKFKRVFSSSRPGSKDAVTHYRVLNSNARHALLEITLETGRKNQIRVHLGDIGCPVVGDAKYGAKTNPIERLALHAFHLEFPHPSTGEQMAFVLRTPKSFETLLASSRTPRGSEGI